MADVIAGIVLFLALVSAAVLSFRLVATLVRLGRISGAWEVRCLTVAVLFSGLLVVLVETVGLLQLLSAFGLAAAWLFAAFLLHLIRQQLPTPESAESAAPKPFFPEAGAKEEKFLKHGIGWSIALLFIIALLYAPSASDPIVRDLIRVVHWIGHGSAAHFPTYDPAHLQAGPLQAYFVLHAYLVGTGDQLAPLVPWAGLVFSLVAIKHLTEQLFSRYLPSFGKGSSSACAAKVWSAALALGFLLAINALFPGDVRFVAIFYFLAIAVFGLLLISGPANQTYAVAFAAAFALTLLAEERLAIASVALAASLLFFAVRTAETRVRVRLFGTVVITVLVLCSFHYLRNWSVFGKPGSFFPSVRAQLVVLLLAVPFVAMLVAPPRLKAAKMVIGVVLLLGVSVSIFFNPTRPVLNLKQFGLAERERQRFFGAGNVYAPAAQAVDDVLFSGNTNVAFYVGSSTDALARVEYPLAAMLSDRGFDGEIFYAGVNNATARLATSGIPQVLIGTRSPLPERLKYELDYGPLATYWSELGSRWIRFSQIMPDKTQRLLSSTNQELIVFEKNAAIFTCRAPRQGVLTLDGGFGDPQGLLRIGTALAVKSRAGFVTTSRSTNALHIVEIPLPPGQSEFQLGPGFPLPSETVFVIRSWNWYPTEQPLPFIYISKIHSATTSLEPNTLIVGSGSELTVELISGAVGVVDLQIYAQGVDAVPMNVAIENFRTNISFRAGAAVARIPVERGTNQATLSTSTNSLLLDRIEPRFRDFVE